MKRMKRLFALTLVLMLISCLSLSVFATEEPSETEQDYEWVLSEDNQTLTWGDEVYTRYEIPENDWFRPYMFYEYNQTMDTGMYGTYYVDLIGQPVLEETEDDVVICADMAIIYDYMADDAVILVFVNEYGEQILDAYMAGQYEKYDLSFGYGYNNKCAPISENMVKTWNAATPDLEIDVTTLKDASHYEILGYDQTLTLAHVIGAVYEIDGQYVYLHYDKLDNNHFDADGNLSFRSGTVPALRLNSQQTEVVDNAIEDAESFSVSMTYEQTEPLEGGIAMILMVLMLFPPMVMLPCITLVLGVTLACIRSVPGRGRWLLVAILSLLWILFAVILGLTLIILAFVLA